MSNSIRVVEEKKGDASAVTRVRQLFQDPEIRKKVITLIEGSDDNCCFKHLLSQTNVYLHPLNIRFHEKVIRELVTKYPTKLISIKDADFCRVNNVNPVNSNMFITDAHDLETMMLNNDNLVALAVDYPGLADNIDKNALCEVLKDYSYMKWYNYNGRKKLAFDELNTVSLYEKGKFNNTDILFSEVCAVSSVHTAAFEEYEAFRKAHPIDAENILCITNGHDLMDCIYSEMHRQKRGNLSKAEVFKSFYKNYTIQMFQQTQLHSKLYEWAQLNGQVLFDVA